MIYSTPEFLLLFVVVLGAYLFLSVPRHRAMLLLGASLVFYAWAGLFDAAIFFFVVAASWGAAIFSVRQPRHAKLWLGAGVVVMVAHLFFWKYASWATTQLQACWPGFLGGRQLNLPLPVGISFFTLQGIAYLVDLGAGRAQMMPFGRYLLFKSFFAQLVAGPIVRSRQLAPQLEALPRPGWEDFSAGLGLFVMGFFKKLMIADKLAAFVDEAFRAPGHYQRHTLVLALLCYAVQIWADFSGYTDMGRGCARMLGIRLPENFLSPYLARSPTEFWRRWHVTLSEWIRDYIYIPLGGSRGSAARATAVLLGTMAISGLWHGASWTFVAWGVYHGLLLIGDRALPSRRGPAARVLAWPVTFASVVFGWLIFRAPNFTIVAEYVRALVFGGCGGVHGWNNNTSAYAALVICALFHLIEYRDLESGDPLVRVSVPSRPVLAGVIAGTALAVVFTCTVILRPFTNISRAFIYFQF